MATPVLRQNAYGMTYFDHSTGGCPYPEKIGTELFHGHRNALAVARNANRRAGYKAKRVIVAKQHFAVVPARHLPPAGALELVEHIRKAVAEASDSDIKSARDALFELLRTTPDNAV